MPGPYSEWEINPVDTGYTIRTDYDASGNPILRVADPVVGGTAGSANLGSLVTKAQAALTANQNYLAIGSPTNAQAVAQTQALTRQVNAIIYYLLHEITGLNSISGT